MNVAKWQCTYLSHHFQSKTLKSREINKGCLKTETCHIKERKYTNGLYCNGTLEYCTHWYLCSQSSSLRQGHDILNKWETKAQDNGFGKMPNFVEPVETRDHSYFLHQMGSLQSLKAVFTAHRGASRRMMNTIACLGCPCRPLKAEHTYL